MTHPPATCELCGDTGLYSPSALPCPKGCKEFDIVRALNEVDHESLEDCFLQSPLFLHAAEYITNMQQYISELEQREKDARVKALEDAATLAEGSAKNFNFQEALANGDDIEVGAKSEQLSIAIAIRALKDEVR